MKPQLIENFPEADYHKHPAISRSGLVEILNSPAHFKANRETPREPTDAMEEGTALHRLLLEPDRFLETVAKGPDCARNKTEWKEFEANNPSKICLKPAQYDAALGQAQAWKSHRLYSEAVAGASFETTLFWQMEGLECKARLDIMSPHGWVLDYKTYGGREPLRTEWDCRRYVSDNLLHVQGAWYLDASSLVTGKTFDRFYIIVIEKKPPFGIRVLELKEDAIAKGREIYTAAFRTYADCVRQNYWPCYPEEVLPISLTDRAANT